MDDDFLNGDWGAQTANFEGHMVEPDAATQRRRQLLGRRGREGDEVEARTTRSAARLPHELIDWPEVSLAQASRVRETMWDAYDNYHRMQPLSAPQLSTTFTGLMSGLWRAFNLPGSTKRVKPIECIGDAVDGLTSRHQQREHIDFRESCVMPCPIHSKRASSAVPSRAQANLMCSRYAACSIRECVLKL
ncbi:hypothetical protein PHSY_003068 [Pseudozyma hubeiensis SY62]|uniref:Uncharacterized protein n=1 Tax=Pseudozyma hubeiensis (strain SY62) TaxID=1305764 RepID=R9P2N9_PSEHS|nr:hypothetical protein PHSY_003068 [Pseudozyma hubeiensis SY62]GAC95492.1 hypothetical protein PHSY_003068 [Pseudozyma hubeiensis SY62]